MAQPNFDYQGALESGYSPEEIDDFLKAQSKKAPVYEKPEPVGKQDTFGQRVQKAGSNIARNARNFFGNFGGPVEKEEELEQEESPINLKLLEKVPNFDVKSALESGYSPEEVNEFLAENQPERSYLAKGARVGAQLGLGAIQGSPPGIAYDVATAPLASKESTNELYREELSQELDQLIHQKASGQWTPEDQKYLEHVEEQIKDPRKSMEYAHTMNVGIRDLAEKASGVDLHPEGILEKAANWVGFIKKPTNWKEVGKLGFKPKEFLKAISPSLTETTRSLTAGTALQMAEEGNFGPAGTIAAAVAGDLIGFGPKGIYNLVKNPKRTFAQATNIFTGANSDKVWVNQVLNDAREAGVQLDAGTLTKSNVIKMAQARAAQSALSGKALDNFRKDLSGQIVKEYSKVVDELGTLTFENNYQAAESVRNFINKEQERFERFYSQRENISGEQAGKGSLRGRIATEAQPNYQEELLNRIAPREFESSYQAGENLKTAAEDIKAPIKQEFNQQWENLNRQVGKVPAGPQAQLARSLDVFVNDHAGSLLLGESSAEARVLQTAQRLRNALVTEGGDLIGVSLEDLIKTKRTLGDVANWEFGGSNFQSAYKHLTGEIDHAIERTLGEVNPQLRQAYEELNHSYSSYKDLFENKNVMPLFEPKNQNYNSMYNSFLKNPDKLRSLEDIMFNNPRGQQLIGQVKRDYAQSVIERPNLTARDLRDLEAVLGPQYGEAIQDFVGARHRALAQPLPRAARGTSLGVSAAIPETTRAAKPIGRAVEKNELARRKLFEYIQGKSSDQILEKMGTVDGIKQIKRALSLTPEGEELFKQLARYKLAEMIDKKMLDSLKENVKLGTFSNLLKSSGDKAIVKELVGPESFKQLERLQRLSGELQDSAMKFYNASQSGTTLTDAALVSTAVTGALTGNIYLAVPAVAKIGGLKAVGYILTDPQFLKYLEEAILTDNQGKFFDLLKAMGPHAGRAIIAATTKEITD